MTHRQLHAQRITHALQNLELNRIEHNLKQRIVKHPPIKFICLTPLMNSTMSTNSRLTSVVTERERECSNGHSDLSREVGWIRFAKGRKHSD